ncbi:flagellar biosynthesis protein FlhB [Rheinheimera tangshanensis]|jgi:flagellar biosynthetic protein FlhB|uniref:Flagellar biosynthetic protein FlhB n=1 Tax=Rheinheimera tangshanensis TaxID=400153 RepID=A0A5C8LXV8_9GAMM|nr:flagellar biosynthesis protein FlhB [Rheinheimera tangshanensis]TXK82106.1 flagellar biosynthesis protein FlhB [Rheinheimera tangshanensis]GGM52085.1 flagellar biosynthetic protein FlhB [Rheinheimera tangshanensis]
MSENTGQNKTEQPTEQRLRKSREEGQVARSKELNTALLLLLGSAALLWFADMFMQLFYQLVQSSWQLDKDALKQGDLMTGAIADALLAMLGASLPFLLTLFIASWVAGILPGGAIFSSKLLGPKFSNMNPIAGLGRMFGSESLVELGKSILKVLLLGFCLWGLMSHLATRLLFLQRMDLATAAKDGLEVLSFSLMVLALVLLIVAVIDVPFQQFKVANKLKMTKQEVKDERKSTDGNPEIKGRIRQIQYQIASRRIEDRVPTADVIITNPTHYAVALKYSEKKAKAPYVVAKGVDQMALRIRELAATHQLEIIELPPLARAIYFSTRVDQEVPKGLYTAVAYVLTYVMQLKAYKQGRGQKPAPIPDIFIPSSLQKQANERGSTL